MSDLATARATVRLAFPDRERWEVVIEHELLAVLVHQPVYPLLIARGTEGHGDEGLSFTPLEQCRSVGSWQEVCFAVDRAETLRVAPVAAGTGEDQIANDLIFQGVPSSVHDARFQGAWGRCIRDHFGQGSLTKLSASFVASLLAIDLLGFLESCVVAILQGCDQCRIVGRDEGDALWVDLSEQFLLKIENFTANSVGELDRLEHLIFGDLMAKAFDHHHFAIVCRNDHIQIAFLELAHGWEWNEFAIGSPDPNRCDRTLERQGADVGGTSRTVHGQNVGVVLGIGAQNHALDLDFVEESFGEQGPNRTVDQSARQGLFGRRATFTLEKAPGELARRCKAFAVIASQWEEICSRTRWTGGHCVEDNGVPVLGQNTSFSLLGQLTGFEGQNRIANLFLYTNFHNIKSS